MSSAREYEGRLRFSQKLSHGAPLKNVNGSVISVDLPGIIKHSINNGFHSGVTVSLPHHPEFKGIRFASTLN